MLSSRWPISDRPQLNHMEVHNATIRMMHTMVVYVLEEVDTRDLGVSGFIYVMLVFHALLEDAAGPAGMVWLGISRGASSAVSQHASTQRQDPKQTWLGERILAGIPHVVLALFVFGR